MLLQFYYPWRCNKCTVNDSLLPLKTHSRVHIRRQPCGVNPYVQEGEDSSRQPINLTAAQTVTALLPAGFTRGVAAGEQAGRRRTEGPLTRPPSVLGIWWNSVGETGEQWERSRWRDSDSCVGQLMRAALSSCRVITHVWTSARNIRLHVRG